jgi:hypothetical protein
MEIRKELSKEKKRRPGWVRAVEILLRTGHIGTTGVLFGGAIFAVPFARMISWHQVAIATGGGLVLLGINQSRHWPYQVRGVMAITHVGMLGLIHLYPEYRAQILATVLVIGSVGSHMPGDIRHWSLVHGCRTD